MTPPHHFPSERTEALARVLAIRPDDYARSRNHIEGAVTRLSPYITHGFVSIPEIASMVVQKHGLPVQHKLFYELGWREYFRHVWQHRGESILRSSRPWPLPDTAYATILPDDIRQARTGLPVIDQSVRWLYATGYLHNHARMWLASYIIHLRKIHWTTGAEWMLSHLLDGDLASNHLSWQWVVGTGNRKPYLFNAENVARYAPATWHSPGTVIDTSYEQLDTIARSTRAVASSASGEGIDEPPLFHRPSLVQAPDVRQVKDRDIWLVHPWALNEVPDDLPAETVVVGWWPAAFHQARPWSAARWGFVGRRMATLAPVIWCSDSHALAQALLHARSVQTVADPHIDALLPTLVVRRPAALLFPFVKKECGSFSAWWRQATRGMNGPSDLMTDKQKKPI